MRITACTERIFLEQLAPLAHLPFGEVCAVNDNKLQLPMSPALCPHYQPRSVPASHAAQRDAQKQENAEGGFHSKAAISGRAVTGPASVCRYTAGHGLGAASALPNGLTFAIWTARLASKCIDLGAAWGITA
jgi:hypothetical protein